jgi:hypothetical protein
LGSIGETTNKLIEYLVKVCPSSLEARCDNGYTPLFLACLLGRVQFAKRLINAGADQSVKDKDFNNIIHACVTNNPKKDQLRQMLGLFDHKLRAHMFCQRNSLASGGDTPLHAWLKETSYQYVLHSGQPNPVMYNPAFSDRDENLANVAIFRLLLDFSKGEELEILNGLGDTVLHTTVMRSLPEHTSAVLDQNPNLLCRENAVGRTPSEVAFDIFTNHKACSLRPIGIAKTQIRTPAMIREDPGKFASDTQAPKDRRDATWEVVQGYIPQANNRRRLVSLNEASDVARRLGEISSARRASTRKSRTDEDGMPDEEEQEEEEVDYPSSLYKTCKLGAWAEENPEDD